MHIFGITYFTVFGKMMMPRKMQEEAPKGALKAPSLFGHGDSCLCMRSPKAQPGQQ